MPTRRSLKLGEALSPALLGREAIQLALIAALSVVALLFAPRWLQVVAAVVDAALALVSGVGFGIACRSPRRASALALYGTATAVFALLAVLNLHG